MSALNDILDAIVAEHVTAAVTVGGQALTVVKRKLPKREETVDAAYQVTISGAEDADRIRRIAFGSVYSVRYTVEMTLVTPNDHDGLTNLADHAAWREATRARYMKPAPLASVAAVKRIDILPAPFLDRGDLAEGYDFTQVLLSIETFETRT